MDSPLRIRNVSKHSNEGGVNESPKPTAYAMGAIDFADAGRFEKANTTESARMRPDSSLDVFANRKY